MHLETSSVLIRQLPVEFVKRPDNWNYAPISMSEFLSLEKPFMSSAIENYKAKGRWPTTPNPVLHMPHKGIAQLVCDIKARRK